MKTKDFFEYQNYREILELWLEGRPNKGHGERSKLATATRAHTAYITHVLKGRAEFSPEQALLASDYMGHGDDEKRYFLKLVELARAGSSELKKHIKSEIEIIKAQRKNLQLRLRSPKTLSLEKQVLYYSKWYFTAVHFALFTGTLTTDVLLAQALHITLKQCREALALLVKMELAEKSSNGHYRSTQRFLHLERESPLIAKHHANWRARALEAMDQNRTQDLHYSSVITISQDDENEIFEILTSAIEKVRTVVRRSDEKGGVVYSYCLDFFPVTEKI